MHFIISNIIFLCLAATTFGAVSTWEYLGDKNPLEWPKLFPACGGVRQSPVDFRKEDIKYGQTLKPFTITQTKGGNLPNYTLINDGHKVEIELPGDTWQLTFQSESIAYCFKPLQMHWHWGSSNSKGSEHLLNGNAFPLELHIVTYDCRLYNDSGAAVSGVNGLAVLGIWYEIDDAAEPDPILTAITEEFKKTEFRQCLCQTKGEKSEASIAGFDIAKLLPSDVKSFYRYMGSLTTPPCTENVLWTVYAKPMKITTKQMDAFRNLLYPAALGSNKPMVDNYRPVQLVNSMTPVSTIRYVSASFKGGVSSGAINAPSLFLLLLLGFLSVVLKS